MVRWWLNIEHDIDKLYYTSMFVCEISSFHGFTSCTSDLQIITVESWRLIILGLLIHINS